MKDYEDEAFDELEKSLQRKVAHGVTDGSKKDAALRLAREALENNRRSHHYCEDTWYSCPKHEDGCANDSEGDECNCGADSTNFEIDTALAAIDEALEDV